MKIGDLIRTARLNKEYTLRRCAEMLGVSPTYLSFVERNKTFPSKDFICSAAKLLNMDVDETLIMNGMIPDFILELYFKHPREVREFLRTVKDYGQEDWDRLFNIYQIEN